MTRLLLCLMVGVLLGGYGAPLATTVAAEPLALAPERGRLGLEFGQVIDNEGQIRFTDEAAARMVEAGATWVRINFRLGAFRDWNEMETFGYPALSLYDEIVATAERHGLEVLGLLSNETWHGDLVKWQENSAEVAGGNGDNDYLREFAAEAAVPLVQHFAGRVDHWEVWNEPNAPPTYVHPSNFAWLLAHVYAGARNAGVASARFISGGLSSKQELDGSVTGRSTGADYLSVTYAHGKDLAGWEEIRAVHGSYPLDAIGQHVYVDGYRRTERETVRTTLQLVRDAYVASEGSDARQTVVTEVGWASSNVSEQTQADNLQKALAEIVNTPYVQTASWFFLKDSQGGSLTFGLLRSDGSEKLAWQGYRIITFPETPPLPPAGPTATGFANEIRLDWQQSAAPDFAGYLVSRGPSPAGPFEQLTPAPITDLAYVDADVPLGEPLYYRVTVVDTGGNVSAGSVTVGAARTDLDGLEPFRQTWARTDQPVADGLAQRTWMWGAAPFSGVITERYDDAPGAFRQVQYFDKSRMELTDPEADEDADWYVTNGLLVYELMTGYMQVGDRAFIERDPARVNVAGDPGTGPTYAALSPLRWADGKAEDEPIIERVDAEGKVTEDPALAERGVTTAMHIPETDHTIAGPFWEFMNSTESPDRPVAGSEDAPEDEQPVGEPLFPDPFYATGYPITEAYWTEVTVAGNTMDVLIQCFQRRCLTYTPDNPEGWQVEAGNVGWHYYQWRYHRDTMN